jgi:AcrR family transcriptional regulator
MFMYPVRQSARRNPSRERVLGAVKELLEAGTFHASTVEEVAARAGVSRATLYQHFGSRLGLVDAMCELMAANPLLTALRETDDPGEFLARVTEFWASEERLLAQLYGAAAIDPAARAFVERQRRDRYGELRRLLAGRDADAVAAFAVISSFEAYLELRRGSSRSKREVVRTLQAMADRLLAS